MRDVLFLLFHANLGEARTRITDEINVSVEVTNVNHTAT